MTLADPKALLEEQLRAEDVVASQPTIERCLIKAEAALDRSLTTIQPELAKAHVATANTWLAIATALASVPGLQPPKPRDD